MSLTEWQSAVRDRTNKVMKGRRAQPLALLNREVKYNPEPWQALCSGAISYAIACFEQLRLGTGEISGTSHRRLTEMVAWIDSRADEWRGEALIKYGELRRLIGELDPEALPERDEMDRQHSAVADPSMSIA